MTVKANILGISGNKAEVVNGDEVPALAVATRPLKVYKPSTRFFTNKEYGVDMNKNVAYGGTPENVHNGIDNVYWTATAIVGTWDFNSTDEAYDGTHSIDGTGSRDDSIFDIDKGSDIDLTGYTALTGYIYITGWNSGNALLVQGREGGVNQGNPIDITDYVDTNHRNAWQQFQITVEDLGLAGLTIDTLRFTNESRRNNFYLDKIQIQETGGGLDYVVTPDKGCWCYINNIRMTLARNVSTVLENASMRNLSYDNLLGITLANGLLFRAIIDGEIQDSATMASLSDMLQLAGTRVFNTISDGTNSLITIERHFETPLILRAQDEDRLVMTLQDDMSSFLLLRVNVNGYIEDRSVK